MIKYERLQATIHLTGAVKAPMHSLVMARINSDSRIMYPYKQNQFVCVVIHPLHILHYFSVDTIGVTPITTPPGLDIVTRKEINTLADSVTITTVIG